MSGWADRYADALAPVVGAWETVAPTVQRRKKPDGTYEYRPTPADVKAERELREEETSSWSPASYILGSGADPGLPRREAGGVPAGAPGLTSDAEVFPEENDFGYGRIGRGILSGMKGGVDFMAHVPELMARGVGSVGAAGDKLATPNPELDPVARGKLAAGYLPTGRPAPKLGSASILPPLIEDTFQSTRDERDALADEAAARGAAAGRSPEASAFSYAIPQTVGNLLDPTMLLGASEVKGLAGAAEKGWAKRYGGTLAKMAEEEGGGALADIGRPIGLHTPEEAELLARRAKVMPAIPGAEEPFLPRDVPQVIGQHATDLDRDIALGLRAKPGTTDDLLRQSLDIAPAIDAATLPPAQVQRLEDPGVAVSYDKPHGLYTSPLGVESPHKAYLRGDRVEGRILSPSRHHSPLEPSAGIAALRELAGPDEARRFLNLRKDEAARELRDLFGFDQARHDTHELAEVYGAELTRRRGYDAIWAPDGNDPNFSEFVGLSDKAFLREPQDVRPIAPPPPRLPIPALPEPSALDPLVDGWGLSRAQDGAVHAHSPGRPIRVFRGSDAEEEASQYLDSLIDPVPEFEPVGSDRGALNGIASHAMFGIDPEFMPEDMLVARRLPSGEVIRGKKGWLHTNLVPDDELASYSESELGYVLPGQDFVSREEGAKWIREQRAAREDLAKSEELAFARYTPKEPPSPPGKMTIEEKLSRAERDLAKWDAANPRALPTDWRRSVIEAGVERLRKQLPPPPPRLPIPALPEPSTLAQKDFVAIADMPPDAAAAVHHLGVEQAVQAGEPVPQGVLKDYPDLAADVAIPVGSAGERGFVKVPQGPSFLARWFSKDGEFAAMGDLKGYAFERSGQATREIKAGQRHVANVLRDWSSAFEDDVTRAGHQNPTEVLDYITRGLDGENDLSGVSPRLRSAAMAMRDDYDRLAAGYSARTDLPKALRDAVEENARNHAKLEGKGTYQHRAFEGFENPDWPSIVDPSGPRHDPREAWRWNEFMDFARKERDDAASRPLYGGAVVRVSDQAAQALSAQHGGGFENGRLARVTSFDAQTDTATITFDVTGTGPAEAQVPRADVTNLSDYIRGDWTDDQLTGYAQRLLNKDPDAFLSVGQSAIGREGRGNLKRRILQDPRVDDLPTDLAALVNDGKLSLPGAIDQARQRPGWFSAYIEHAKGLPEEIDNLLGLYKDPAQRYKHGVMRSIHDQATYRMHDDLAKEGLGTIFHEEPMPGFYDKIGGKGPLANLHTSPEIAMVIRGTENTSRQAGPLMTFWQKVNAVTKLGKTALNFPAGHMRNIAAWPFQLMAGGHYVAAFNPARPLQLLPYQIADKLGTQRGHVARLGKMLADSVELADGSRLGERWAMHLDELRPEIQFLYEKGVFGESTHASDLKHYMGQLAPKREPAVISGVRKAVKASLDLGINFWAGGDDMGKHIYYRAELQNLLWAEGKLGATEKLPADYFLREEFKAAADEAARRTRLTTPSASMISPGVKAMRDAPLAPFPGWTSEVFRNAKEQVKLGLSDLASANPRQKILGAKRLSGFLGMSALAGGGLAAGMNALSGVKEPGAVRSFVPPWSRDSQLAVLNVDKAGKVRYVDASALLPYAAFADFAGIILRSIGDPQADAHDTAIDAAQSLIGPYVDEEIVASAVLDWARNKKQAGGPAARILNMARHQELPDQGYDVYTPGAAGTTQLKQSAYHFWRALAPAGIAGLQGERLARALTEDNPEVRKFFVEMTNYDKDLEIADEGMAALGLRVSTTDVTKALSRTGSDYARRRTEASSMYTRRSRMGTAGIAHPDVALAAKAEANQMARAAHEQTARVVADALRLGFNEAQVRGWLEDGRVSRKHRNALLQDAQLLLQGKPPQYYIPVVQ